MKRKWIIPILILATIICVVYADGGISLNSSLGNIEQGKDPAELEVITKSVNFDNDIVEGRIQIPVLVGENKKELLDQINTIMETDMLKFKNGLFQLAEEDFERAKKDHMEFRKYELLVDYKVHTVSNRLVSISCLNYQYTGGAHGMTVQVPYNFDLATGQAIRLKDLLKEESNYRKIINEEIHKQIKEEPDEFFPDEVEVFSGIRDDQSFFIRDGKLIIYFNPYEIAPYASGIIEFEIPSNILKDLRNTSLIN